MSESVLKKFGKYFLLDRIGEGGMAEIFRARMATPESNGRFIVIKRIQGAFSNNQEFVQMFRAEVQVTMRFSHPNIVQLYESGEDSGQHYIAMELVEGRNLRQVLSKISQKQQRIPIPASAFIIEQAAAGLNYAHQFKDRITGEPLNLVHRDVSPQNILVSYDGNIKVIDFGIAKAATNGEATRAGVIKGKLSYLSPEQVMGDVLDGRSDIFALGIVLWELLTGKRLFVADGDNEFQVLKMIESCNSYVKPPSTYNPEISKDLDAVVMQALARDPKKRFQNGDEMGRALRKLLAVEYSDFGPSDLSIFVKKLFHDLIVEDRKQLQQLNSRADELIALGTPAKVEPVEAVASPTAQPKETPKEQTRVNNLGDKFDKSQITSADRVEIARQPQNQMRVPSAARPGTQTGIRSTSPSSRGTSTGIRRPVAYTEPVQQASGSSGILKLLGGAAMVAIAGFFAFEQFNPVDRKPDSVSIEDPTPTVQNPFTSKANLRVRIFPDGDLSKTRISVNSAPFDLNKGFVKLNIDEPVELVIERQGFVTYRKEFTVKQGDLSASREYLMDVKLDPMVYGTFTLSTQPEIADVSIVNLDQGTSGNSSKPLILKTPVYQEKLAVGHYRVTVRNETLNVEKSFQIEVKEGDRLVKNGIALDPVRSPATHQRR
jgi:serine/threonine-protein kinase